MSELGEFEKFISGEEYNESYPLSERDEQIAWYFWQACAELKDAIIEQQAEELVALRGFVKSMREYQDNVIMSAVIRECLAFNLTDNRGKPTKLLTGGK